MKASKRRGFVQSHIAWRSRVSIPKCPKCSSEFTYEDGDMFICPECTHEWPRHATIEQAEEKVWKDAVGNLLSNGDTVTVVKDLKFKGSSSVIKVGTKVKNIRLIEGDHDIDCKVEGFGPIQLKSEFVRKV
jgi:protein PhnA